MTLSSTDIYAVGDIVTITGATGAETSKLNGSWTITSKTSTTLVFSVNVNFGVNGTTYTSGLGTTTILRTGYIDSVNSKFWSYQANAAAPVATRLESSDMTQNGLIFWNGDSSENKLETASEIIYKNRNLGIGTDNPESKLHVSGNTRINGTLNVSLNIDADSIRVNRVDIANDTDGNNEFPSFALVEYGNTPAIDNYITGNGRYMPIIHGSIDSSNTKYTVTLNPGNQPSIAEGFYLRVMRLSPLTGGDRYIRWSETAQKWQFTNDGTNYYKIPEPTDYSPLAGSSSITTLGTVTSGTWSASTIAVARGGTGQTTLALARNAMGLGNTTGPVPIANGGTGATTAEAARNALGLGNTTGALPVANGGTGQTTYTNGQLLIGNTTGNTLAKGTLTGTTNRVTVTNGAGTITLSGPQDIHTAATPTFAGLISTGGLTAGSGTQTWQIESGTSNLLFRSGSTPTTRLTVSDAGVVTATTFVGALTGTASGNLTSSSTLTAGNLSGTIPSAVLGNSSLFIGTTSVALNRASATLALTGVTNTNWDAAYTHSQVTTGAVHGATTVGNSFFRLTNPSAVTFPRMNADNTVTALNAADFRTAIGAGTSSTVGTVTSVAGTGTVSGLTLTGTVTSTGNLTLGGTFSAPISSINDSTSSGQALVKITNPGSAGDYFLRLTRDGSSVFTSEALTAATFRSAIGAGTSSTTGTVTSVGLSLPTSVFTGTGSVTTSGTLTRTFANQSANTVFAGPTTGLPDVPAFRTLVAEDLPAHTHAASAITSGTLAIARGGTNSTSVAQGGIIYGASTSAYASTAAGTSGQLLRSNGTGAPSWTSSLVDISNFTGPISSNGTNGVTLNVTETIAIGNKYAIEVSDSTSTTANNMLLFWEQKTASSTTATNGQTFTFTARSISTTTTVTYKFVVYRSGTSSFNIINAYTHTLGTGSSHPIATTTLVRAWRIYRVL